MKPKMFIQAMMLVLMMLTVPAVNGSEKEPQPFTKTATAEADRSQQMIDRLVEIKRISKSENLTREEKKKLRQETRNIEKELKKTAGGIYLSVGAIIIIALLLIILL